MAQDLKKKLIENYWISKLSQTGTVCSHREISYANERAHLNKAQIAYLAKVTSEDRLSEYALLLGIYGALLRRYFQDELSFIFAPGHFQNNKWINQALLFSMAGTEKVSLKGYLELTKLEVQEVYSYSRYHTDSLINKLKGNSFQNYTHFALAYFGQGDKKTKPDCSFELSIYKDLGGGLELFIDFAETFMEKSVAHHFLNNYIKWIINLEEYLNKPLSEITILQAPERELLLHRFNDTQRTYPAHMSIVDFFEKQVNISPDSLAVIYKDKRFSYSELNIKANKLAHYLVKTYRLGPGDIVGVLLPKSDTALITILAILKTGASYLPIDINYPAARVEHLINDSKPKLLIYTGNIPEQIHTGNTLNIGDINDHNEDTANLEERTRPDDLAYVIYTSGSTGNPKGVQVEHGGIVNMIFDQIRTLHITKQDRVVWFASPAFDASMYEIMMALFSGAAVTIAEEGVIKDRNYFATFLRNTKSTVVTLPPSYLDLLDIEDLYGLRCIITAGEQAHSQKAVEIAGMGIEYFNAYGPTECSVCVSTYKVKASDSPEKRIPIGKPISNLKTYILDAQMKPLPVGVTGTLFVSGVGLSRGYLNLPEISAEKFMPNPFADGERIYNTGDLVRWRPDGNLEFIGRKDSQVKIRGYRIELGEIESALLSHDMVLQAVAVDQTISGGKIIVAYIVAEKGLDKRMLKAYLSDRLPEYMLPAHFVTLNSIPLSTNGKVNKRALPKVSEGDMLRRDYIAPTNETEQTLAQMWQELLGIGRIGITDNFFELGGNSIQAVNFVNLLNKTFGTTLSIKDLYATRQIKELAELLSFIRFQKQQNLESRSDYEEVIV